MAHVGQKHAEGKSGQHHIREPVHRQQGEGEVDEQLAEVDRLLSLAVGGELTSDDRVRSVVNDRGGSADVRGEDIIPQIHMIMDHDKAILAKLLIRRVEKLERYFPHKSSPTRIGAWRTNNHVADGKRCSIFQVTFRTELIPDMPKRAQIKLCVTADKEADSAMRKQLNKLINPSCVSW